MKDEEVVQKTIEEYFNSNYNLITNYDWRYGYLQAIKDLKKIKIFKKSEKEKDTENK